MTVVAGESVVVQVRVVNELKDSEVNVTALGGAGGRYML